MNTGTEYPFDDDDDNNDTDQTLKRQYPIEKMKYDSTSNDDKLDNDDDDYDDEYIEQNDTETIDKNCFYKYVFDDDDVVYDDFDDDEIKGDDNDIVPSNKRITKPILFKFERVRMLGDRVKQLSLGAKPMLKNVSHLTLKEIAILEIEKNVIPLIIYRKLANGKKEKWYISELKSHA
uniref:RNA polymerase subunit 6 n=1 Tax=Mimivirus LCMiAC01 TaxID=2506608 RepID=A0A481YZQ7_9VIRU|nr:MAG: RNA polymerase subunit 6 [Mimivirus LCMiAC01]